MTKISRALISVSDKRNIEKIVAYLNQNKIEIISTGGTYKKIKESSENVLEISEYTNFPEIMNGRVKTLNPLIHGGVLADRDNEQHKKDMNKHEIKPIDLVIVNLYPFEEVVLAGADYKTAIDNFGINPIANDKVEIEDNPTEIITETSETITESVKEPISNNENLRVLASPLAKKIAKEKSIDLNLISGSGDNGRIIKDDVENFTPTVVSDFTDNSPPTIVESGTESFEDIENSQMRKTIARRLKESKFSAPHYYLSVEFEMDNAIAFRNQYNSLPETKISFNDIVVKACAIALKHHPRVNSQWFDDKMRLNHHVHVGVAVGVPDGLVVPVIRFANEKSIPEIGSLVKSYASKARDKKLSPDEMQGSTFTVSNLGMFGIEEFTSIINQPNSAILSVGTIVKKPVVRDDKITIGHTMKITLACDHRTVDGVTGSLFLQTLKGFVENPVTMLV